MTVTHTTVGTVADDPDAEINKAEWNAAHTVGDGSFVAAKLSATATDKVFGRSTAGAGNGEEIALTAAGRALIDDADAAAQRTTLGAAAASHNHAGSDINSGTVAIARIASGTPDGTKFVRDDGVLAVPPGTGGGLTSLYNAVGSNINLTNADQYYDGPAVTLAAGTWLLIGGACIDPGSNTSSAHAKLWDGTTVGASGQQQIGIGYTDISLACIAVVASGTPTWKISCASTSTGGRIMAATPANGSGNNASYLNAIKIA